MRIIGLILLSFAVFSLAEPPPPEPPRVMVITMKDGSTEAIPCSRIDPEVGVIFIDHGMKMKVGLVDTITYQDQPVFKWSDRWYVTDQIDNISFPLLNPPEPGSTPTPEPAPGAGLIKRSSHK